jgi:hypothetical protein
MRNATQSRSPVVAILLIVAEYPRERPGLPNLRRADAAMQQAKARLCGGAELPAIAALCRRRIADSQ